MKWITLLLMLCNSARADILLDLMMQNSYIDELESEDVHTIDEYSEAEWYSWQLKDSEDLVIIYDSDCEWQE
jgi:hypothetical protein